MTLPSFFTVRQKMASHRIEDVGAVVTDRLSRAPSITQIRRGQSVAVAVGSRGIDRIFEVTRAVTRFLQSIDAVPFIIPAMGSHGGATGEGQAGVLASLGIDHDSVGCPIKSSMETISIGHSSNGIPLYFDRNAASADHLIAINRIKPHTRLTGGIQSGLCKMLMIGLGKHQGALAFHPAFQSIDYRLDSITQNVIPTILKRTPFLAGIAIIEDALDSIGSIEVVSGPQLLEIEPDLLKTAVDWMPGLPFERAEFLIVDSIGKEISGTGLDTNVVGRKWHDKVPGPEEWPKINEIYVRSLTTKTAGNGSGIGIAEYTHRNVAESIDVSKTRINCITAGHPTAAALPVWFDSDREVLDAVCAQSPMPGNQRRWMRIQDTLKLSEVRCSESYLDEANRRQDLEVLDDPQPLRFDPKGDFCAPS